MTRLGQCRRAAPMLMPKASTGYIIEGVWPTVRDDDWCGEWKILPRRPAMASVPVAGAGVPAHVVSLPAMAMAGD